MSRIFLIIAFQLLFLSPRIMSQKKWDGGGGNNLWNNALNWTGNTVPTSTDDILLDNSLLATNYTVTLPSTAVTVRTITITPAAGKTLSLTLPSTNTAVPGLTVTGPGYGLVINSGGTFRNSSGSTSGTTLMVTDSIRVNNDGRYIHNSASGHSTNVQILSRAPGTENGSFELDIPVASSTISISGRTFGNLVLKSAAAGGTCNYTAAGTSRVNIRGQLNIGTGVNLNLNCSDTIFVTDFTQDGGIFNLGNSTRSVVLSVSRHVSQAAGSTITESGTGIQTFLLNAAIFQFVAFSGTISNQVALVKDNVGSAFFKGPVSLPYKLWLKKGYITTSNGLITLQPSCTIQADSLSGNCGITGPLKKDGLVNQSFLFPVGKSTDMRWLQLYNATGSFIVEYFNSDPRSISSTIATGIHHISSVEYWDVTSSGTSTANVKLSFAYPESGAITDLSSLRVARLINGTWQDAGNIGVSGTPGSDGWVSSNAAGGFSADTKSFALASAIGQENPLPISSLQLTVTRKNSDLFFAWTSNTDLSMDRFELQRSFDGINFSTIYFVRRLEGAGKYSFKKVADQTSAYFRLVAYANDGIPRYFGEIVYVKSQSAAKHFTIEGSNIATGNLKLSVSSDGQRSETVAVYNMSGALLKTIKCGNFCGRKFLNVDVSSLKPGLYIVSSLSTNLLSNQRRFVKL
jgi:hypothetical protein